jgi:hypothetical protein
MIIINLFGRFQATRKILGIIENKSELDQEK